VSTAHAELVADRIGFALPRKEKTPKSLKELAHFLVGDGGT
jgi:hypothetical protein